MQHLPTLCAISAASSTAAASSVDYDVVVYGSSPAGVAAATTAAALGHRVALLEPLSMIGGMGAAGGLALNDGFSSDGGHELTGLAKKFTQLNALHYGKTKASDVNLTNWDMNNDTLGVGVPHPESFVAEASFYKMMADANVEAVEVNCRLLSVQQTSAEVDTAQKIESINVLCRDAPVTATVFIDASYDGDVMVGTKTIPYTAGREAKATYGESHAGTRTPGPKTSVVATETDPTTGEKTLIPFVQNISTLAAPGSADDALMAFQHRMCITSKTDNMLPFPAPKGYNADDFVLLQRYIELHVAKGEEYPLTEQWQLLDNPGLPAEYKKHNLCCGISIAASDQPHLNKGWASASWEERQAIIEKYIYFELGSLHYLQNDPKVPKELQEHWLKYGLCKDEFVHNNNLPVQFYVRVSNRMVSDYVMTQNNITLPYQNKEDSIGINQWNFDQHMTGKYGVPSSSEDDADLVVMLEGNFWVSLPGKGGSWHEVPYRAIIPKKGSGGANLLVPVALSASSVAYSAARIENMYMNVGSGAGVAAAEIVEGRAATVHDVDVSNVQDILVKTFKQRVHGPPHNTHGA